MDTDEAPSEASDARPSIAAPPPADDPPYQVVDTLVRFLTLQLAGNISQGMGLTESKIQFLCKSHKGSLPAVLTSLTRDGWLPTSVSDQVMSYEFSRFAEGASSLHAGSWCTPLLMRKSCFTDIHTSMTHYCPGSKPIPIQGAVHQVDPAGVAAAACTREYYHNYAFSGPDEHFRSNPSRTSGYSPCLAGTRDWEWISCHKSFTCQRYPPTGGGFANPKHRQAHPAVPSPAPLAGNPNQPHQSGSDYGGLAAQR